MKDLLVSYSVSEILIFLVMIAVAVKSLVTFYDWAIGKLRKLFHKETQQEKERNELNERLRHGAEIMNELAEQQAITTERLNKMLDRLQIVIESDKDDIKAWITEKHHYFCKKGEIDYLSLDTIEKRYQHYVEEDGNSFVEDLMQELRALPKITFR